MVEQTKETEATKDIQNSVGYQMSTEATRLSAYENNLKGAAGNFIKKIKRPMEKMFAIEYEGERYSINMIDSMGILYIKRDNGPAPFIISATTEDHKPNYLLINRYSYHPATIELKSCFERVAVFFEDGKCQYMLLNYLMYT